MKACFKICLLGAILIGLLAASGCVSCLPQYTAPSHAPVSGSYPVGHDPYIPMDHNPSPLNFWDSLASVAAPFLYGPPR
ncbi:MAG: hypothetical protein RDU20_08750 [Desulfomonilaceae bacterium]|nr:hypothetical protein [Desulfomonilaceae bacterium]